MPPFIDDIFLENQLYGLTVRSGIPRGRIVNISLPPLPEGYLSVSAREIPGDHLLNAYYSAVPFLAESRVNYMGEPILLLAGSDREQLDELARRIQIDYAAEQPITRPEPASHQGIAEGIHLRRGDPEAGFRDAFQIVEGEYLTREGRKRFPEAQGAVAHWDGRILILYAACHDPFTLRRQVSGLLGVPSRRVRVIAARSQGYPEKGTLIPPMIAGHAALLSFAAQRPVKLIYECSTDESILTADHATRFIYKTALDREGNPLAARITLILDGGAYPAEPAQVLAEAVLAACGCYSCPSVELEAKLVSTNKVPFGFYRPGIRPQAFFAAELHTARLEEVAQADPHLWKKRNLLVSRSTGLTGSRLRGGGSPVLEAVVRASDFRRKHSAYTAMKKRRKSLFDFPHPLRGIGLAVCNQGIGYRHESWEGERYTLRVTLDRDRRCRIYGSLVDTGQGLVSMFQWLAASILDLSPDRVIVEAADTGSVPNTGPTTAGSTIQVGARLLARCCRTLRKKLLSGPPPLEAQCSYKAPKNASWDPLTLRGDPYEDYSWAGFVVELEVDPLTLQPILLGIWAAYEAGSQWNQEWAGVQAEFSVVEALSSVLDWDGYAGDVTLGRDFLDTVPLKIQFIQSPEGPAPEGSASGGRADEREDPLALVEQAKGFDALAPSGVPAAVTAAICQATGLYLDRIPITPEVIQECLVSE